MKLKVIESKDFSILSKDQMEKTKGALCISYSNDGKIEKCSVKMGKGENFCIGKRVSGSALN